MQVTTPGLLPRRFESAAGGPFYLRFNAGRGDEYQFGNE